MQSSLLKNCRFHASRAGIPPRPRAVFASPRRGRERSIRAKNSLASFSMAAGELRWANSSNAEPARRKEPARLSPQNVRGRHPLLGASARSGCQLASPATGTNFDHTRIIGASLILKHMEDTIFRDASMPRSSAMFCPSYSLLVWRLPDDYFADGQLRPRSISRTGLSIAGILFCGPRSRCCIDLHATFQLPVRSCRNRWSSPVHAVSEIMPDRRLARVIPDDEDASRCSGMIFLPATYTSTSLTFMNRESGAHSG